MRIPEHELHDVSFDLLRLVLEVRGGEGVMSARVCGEQACCLVIPTLAKAQASISGVVKDASGAVLPGVTVEAASPALIEKIRQAVSDASGQYRIVDLRPGEYTVTFSLSGFTTVKREGITLRGSMTATVNADLRVGTVQETITVSAEAPLVDVQGVQQQRVLAKDVIDTLPTGRTTTNLAVLVPGMVLSTTFSGESQDVGGNTGDVMQSVAIHGCDGRIRRRTSVRRTSPPPSPAGPRRRV